MKILKDSDRVLRVMDAKLDELRKSRKGFPGLTGKEVAEISGKDVAIINIAGHIRYAIEDHGCFGVEDLECVYEYADGAKAEANKYYHDPPVSWFTKGLAKGATWTLKEIEKRMEEEP